VPLPVIRAEAYYLPPPELPPDTWALMPPAELALAWYEQRAQRRLPRPAGIDLSLTLYARIDAGRWVAQCPCLSAQVATPADPRFLCVECGAGWFRVRFPDDVAAAEAAVLGQLPHERFWRNPDDDGTTGIPATAHSVRTTEQAIADLAAAGEIAPAQLALLREEGLA
jgi:hypothetical protein